VPWAKLHELRELSLHPTSFFYIISDFVLIVAFTFFYVYIAFEPHQQAEICASRVARAGIRRHADEK